MFNDTFFSLLVPSELTSGEVAVVGGDGEDGEGVVLVYNVNKSYGWSSVCENEWDDLDAGVVCRQLGYEGGHSTLYRWVQREIVQQNFLFIINIVSIQYEIGTFK